MKAARAARSCQGIGRYVNYASHRVRIFSSNCKMDGAYQVFVSSIFWTLEDELSPCKPGACMGGLYIRGHGVVPGDGHAAVCNLSNA
jgi:hypothetical protein